MIGVGGSVIGGSQMRELQHAVSEQIETECGDDHDDDGPAVNRDQPAECVEPAGRVDRPGQPRLVSQARAGSEAGLNDWGRVGALTASVMARRSLGNASVSSSVM